VEVPRQVDRVGKKAAFSGPWIKDFEPENTAPCLINVLNQDLACFTQKFPAHSRRIRTLAVNSLYLSFECDELLEHLAVFESLEELILVWGACTLLSKDRIQ